jgi:hypothetical protein
MNLAFYTYISSSADSVEGLLWGAEPIFKLGPALQQADAPSLDHAAPYLDHAAPY